jgi:hypothetical protein
MHYKYLLGIVSFLVVAIIFIPFTLKKSYIENYENNTINNNVNINNDYPTNETYPLLKDYYPLITSPKISSYTYFNNWKKGYYPVFPLSSYTQITNNIKYPPNPDNGECMPADMCFTLYDNIDKSNIQTPLPPVDFVDASESRVNYYKTDSNLLPVPLIQPTVF